MFYRMRSSRKMASFWAFVVLLIAMVNLVESADPCSGQGDSITGASSGFVSSPSNPSSATCIWSITVPSGRIKLSFLNFTFIAGDKTDCDQAQGARLTITNVASDDDNSPFEMCGQSIPAPVYSVGSSIQMTYSGANNLYSFNASYETFTTDMLCPSASQLTDVSGVITSPYYHRNYPNNLDCNWEITASKGNRVELKVTDMEIHRCGQSGLCTCDSLQVLDGFSTADGTASGKTCIDGQFSPLTYYSTNERLRVRFTSDAPASKNFRGFTATYKQLNYTPPECPAAPIPLSGNGSFSSPNFPVSNYPAARNCFWIITASAGKRVKVTIKDFSMGECDDCNKDFCSRVEFYDGPAANSSYLGRFCTTTLDRPPKVSSGQQMFVKFYSSFSLDRGFQAEYSESTDEPSPTVSPSTTTTTTTTATTTTTTATTATTATTTTTTTIATTTTTTITATTTTTAAAAKPPTTGAAALSITLLLVILPSLVVTLFSP